MELLEFDDLEEQMEDRHYVETIKVFEFLNECIHLPETAAKKVRLGLEEGLPKYRTYDLLVFANGRTKNDEGYISVKFDYAFACFFIRGCCIISVIDAYGNQKFSKTFSFFNESLATGNSNSSCRSFYIDRYISRKILLTDPDDVLINGVLTLLIDVHVAELMYKTPKLPPSYEDIFKSCFQFDNDSLKPTKLLLDSPLAECLRKESICFLKMVETPMSEKRTNTMEFHEEERAAFKYIGEILMEKMTLTFSSIKDIFDMYIVANKYDIPAITETCTSFLKLCLFDYTVDEYFKIVNEYEAEGLKELLINEIILLEQSDSEKEIENSDNGAILKLPIRKRLWKYSHAENFLLVFQDVIPTPSIFYGKEPFDFYS